MTSGTPLTPNLASILEPKKSAPLKRRSRRVLMSMAGVAATATVLSGCSAGHFADMSASKTTTPTAHASATASPTAAPTTSAPKVATVAEATKVVATNGPAGGDLAGGSISHELNAGSHALDINYWTDQDPKTWYADQSTVVQLAAHIANGDKAHAVYVSRFYATMDDGYGVTTLADDSGSFVITPPFSYSSGLIIRSSHPAATGATVIIRYELLVQTQPNAMAFYRQTVIDTFHLNFAPKGNN
jgi:hypothetical protein